VESIDPIPPSELPIEGQDFFSRRKFGTQIVGRIHLRHQFVDELIYLTTNSLQSRFDYLTTRMNVSLPSSTPSFIVSYCLATQAYSSLAITNQQSSDYPLKALVHCNVTVPSWLVPLVQTIGNFETSSGQVQVAAIEQLVPLWTLTAIQAVHDMNVGYHSPFSVPERPILFKCSNLKEDLLGILKYHNPNYFGKIELQTEFGSVQVEVDFLNEPVLPLIALIGGDMCLMDPVRKQELCIFLGIRDLNYDAIFTKLHADGNDWFLVDGNRNYPMKDLASNIGIASYHYLNNVSLLVSELFISTPFVPGRGGTSAQFVTPPSPPVSNFSVHSAHAEHDFSLSGPSEAAGMILVPSNEAKFQPKFLTDTNTNRSFMFEKHVRKFDKR